MFEFRSVAALVLLFGLALEGSWAWQSAAKTPSLGVTGVRSGDTWVVGWVQPAGYAWDSGVRAGDLILEINGTQLSTLAPDAAIRAATSIETRSPVGRDIRATAVQSELPTGELVPMYLALAGLIGLTGAVTFLLSEEFSISTAYFLWSLVTAAMLQASIAEESGGTIAIDAEYVAVVGFGFTLALFFGLLTGDRVVKAPSGIFWVVAAGAHVGMVIVFFLIQLNNPNLYASMRSATFVLVAMDVVWVLLMTANMIRQPRDSGARFTWMLLLVGTAAAPTPLVFLSLIPAAVTGSYILSPDHSILGIGIVPITLTVALLSRQFPGIQRPTSRALVAFGVWATLSGAFSLLPASAFLGPVSASAAYAQRTVLLILGVAATFVPLQRLLRRAIERTCFADAYDYERAVRVLTTAIVDDESTDSYGLTALQAMGEILRLRWLALELEGPFERALLWKASNPGDVSNEVLAVPLTQGARRVGTLRAGPKQHRAEYRAEDYNLIQTVAPLLSACLQLSWHLGRSREREDQLDRLSHEVVRVQEQERRALALELHDDALQRLLLLSDEIRCKCQDAEFRDQGISVVNDVAVALRAACSGLYPAILEDLGLEAAIEQLANETRSKTDLSVQVNAQIDQVYYNRSGACNAEVELAAFRTVQEALNNTRKHATATSVVIWVQVSPTSIVLKVADNGRGFDTASASRGGLGLLGMQRRVSHLGGNLKVNSTLGGGCEVSAHIPLVQ